VLIEGTKSLRANHDLVEHVPDVLYHVVAGVIMGRCSGVGSISEEPPHRVVKEVDFRFRNSTRVSTSDLAYSQGMEPIRSNDSLFERARVKVTQYDRSSVPKLVFKESNLLDNLTKLQRPCRVFLVASVISVDKTKENIDVMWGSHSEKQSTRARGRYELKFRLVRTLDENSKSVTGRDPVESASFKKGSEVSVKRWRLDEKKSIEIMLIYESQNLRFQRLTLNVPK
jgi:hypothetical protein